MGRTARSGLTAVGLRWGFGVVGSSKFRLCGNWGLLEFGLYGLRNGAGNGEVSEATSSCFLALSKVRRLMKPLKKSVLNHRVNLLIRTVRLNINITLFCRTHCFNFRFLSEHLQRGVWALQHEREVWLQSLSVSSTAPVSSLDTDRELAAACLHWVVPHEENQPSRVFGQTPSTRSSVKGLCRVWMDSVQRFFSRTCPDTWTSTGTRKQQQSQDDAWQECAVCQWSWGQTLQLRWLFPLQELLPL